MNREWIFGIATAALVLIGVGLAFTVTGSPGHQRALALDERRLDDIEQITSAMIPAYYHKPLPQALPSDIAKNDPETDKPYEYKRLNDTSYQLCANFREASPQDYETKIVSLQWRHHGIGRSCFTYRKGAEYPYD